MMKLNLKELEKKDEWAAVNVTLPKYDVKKVVENTKKDPVWVHFGAGNIFRSFIASLQQGLLNDGDSACGIVAVETYDEEIVSKIYSPYDNLTMNVILNGDGTMTREILASVGESLWGGDLPRLREIFKNPSMQMVSFTVTGKGYRLRDTQGEILAEMKKEMEAGPESPKQLMAVVASLLYTRYQTGQLPIAVVSMDNVSKNGLELQKAIVEISTAWKEKGFVDDGFLAYIQDTSKVTFPWSMIDKITPRPAEVVAENLKKDGIEGLDAIVTTKGSYMAPFVNAERPQYLVVEDAFPNGRPPLEKAGVYFCERDVVNQAETMKVTTCLNPLHTAMAMYGCLLGFESISSEMKDPRISKLVHQLGYQEGLPVVVNPGIINPEEFIKEVITERLPNPFMPDTPQRIATDTSLKMSIRYGETIKKYVAKGEDMSKLVAIPLAIAGWLRYLLAVDDQMVAMPCSQDPLLDTMQASLKGIEVGKPDSYQGELKDILRNKNIFGSDLEAAGLSGTIETMFVKMLAGKNAVSDTLNEYLK